MNRRALGIVIIGVVGVAGLAAGIMFVLSMSQISRAVDEEPTLAPVAIVSTVAAPSATTDAQSEPSAAPVDSVLQPTSSPETPVLTVVSSTVEPTPPPTVPPNSAVAEFNEYIVQSGDTVISIAVSNGVSIEDILAANDQITDPNEISAGQTIRVPVLPSEVGLIPANTPVPTSAATVASHGSATATLPFVPGPTTTVASTATSAPADITTAPPEWAPSVISGDLAANYPLVKQTGSTALLLHYQPGTAPAANIDALAETVDRIYARLQASMNGSVPRQVSVYLGGTLFGVNPSLQGFTQSYEFRSFILVNGAFHPGERDYILGHELTHVAATHILGPASSTMIHEGLATYLPQTYLTDGAGYLPLDQICAAAYQTNAFRSATQLSQLSYGEAAFGGHIRTFFNYNLSGCFVGYLLDHYDMEHLDRVYDSGNYLAVYGMSLGELDAAWQAELESISLSLDAEAFVSTVQEIAGAYEQYITASAGGFHANYQAYLHLNRARLEANRGNLDNAHLELGQFHSLFTN